jgi:hypothetical protein
MITWQNLNFKSNNKASHKLLILDQNIKSSQNVPRKRRKNPNGSHMAIISKELINITTT